MLNHRHCLVLLLGLASGAVAGADEKGVDAWIEQMAQAVHGLAYEGTFVYLHDNQLESMHITHSMENGEDQERLLSLNGAPREVIRNTDSVICILPDAKAVSVSRRANDRTFPAVLPMNMDELSAYYEFRLVGDGRMAGRPAKEIAVIPKDKYRYGYRIFVDTEHGLPLKTDTLNELGEPVTQLMFTTLRVDPSIRAHAHKKQDDYESYTWIQPEPAREIPITERMDWKFKQLPAGFKLKVRALRSGFSGDTDVEHFVFSDGLATLSVYIEKALEEGGLNEESHMGAVNAFGTQISGHQVTVVGEVPALTVRYVVNSIEYAAANGAGQ